MSVIFISHRLHSLKHFADRIYIIVVCNARNPSLKLNLFTKKETFIFARNKYLNDGKIQSRVLKGGF